MTVLAAKFTINSFLQKVKQHYIIMVLLKNFKCKSSQIAKFAIPKRWNISVWKYIMRDDLLALFLNEHKWPGQLLNMFMLDNTEFLQDSSFSKADYLEALFINICLLEEQNNWNPWLCTYMYFVYSVLFDSTFFLSEQILHKKTATKATTYRSTLKAWR